MLFPGSKDFEIVRGFTVYHYFLDILFQDQPGDPLESVFKMFFTFFYGGQVFLKVKDAFLIHISSSSNLSSFIFRSFIAKPCLRFGPGEKFFLRSIAYNIEKKFSTIFSTFFLFLFYAGLEIKKIKNKQ
jgi:hypothetical protein